MSGSLQGTQDHVMWTRHVPGMSYHLGNNITPAGRLPYVSPSNVRVFACKRTQGFCRVSSRLSTHGPRDQGDRTRQT